MQDLPEKVCFACGGEISRSAHYCPLCGHNLVSDEQWRAAPLHPNPQAEAIERLRVQHPWPRLQPKLLREAHGFFDGAALEMLTEQLRTARTVVELGSWLGQSTRWILERFSDVHLVAVDTWLGSAEHFDHPEWSKRLPTLYEQFLANCWPYRGRLTPVRADTITGLQLVEAAGIRPDVVWIDAGHDFWAVRTDLSKAASLWLQVRLCGHDWPNVQRAVEGWAAANGRQVGHNATSWWME